MHIIEHIYRIINILFTYNYNYPIDNHIKSLYNYIVSFETVFFKESVMHNETIREYLANNSIFKHSSPENIELFLNDDTVHVKKFRSGETIFSPECKEKYVGIISSGSAIVATSASPENTLLKVIKENEMFGIANLYSDNENFPSIITAKGDTTVILICENAFKRLLENDKKLLTAYLSLLSNKIVYLNKKISTLTAGSTEKKLCVFLAENEHDGVFDSNVSMSSLSEMLNIGRASLYRALDALSDNGLIIRTGKKIIIPDKYALLQYCK